MRDLIDRTELIKNIEYSFYDYERVRIDTVTGTFLSELFAPSVDAVEVVRCGNCKYYETELCENQDNHEDWFCADGERKEAIGNVRTTD